MFVCFACGCSIVGLLWCLFVLDVLLIVVVCYSLLICCVWCGFVALNGVLVIVRGFGAYLLFCLV